MNSPEYQEILSSLQDITHRAYLLGRSEALKRVIAAMQSDDPPPVPLQLMAPTEFPAPPASDVPPPSAAMPSAHHAEPASEGPAPWWAKPPRPVTGPIRTTH
jgi:hypothetical protein